MARRGRGPQPEDGGLPVSDMRVCGRCGEPLILTMEFAGYEYLCGACGHKEGIFGARAGATADRQLRLDELTEAYERDRAARGGLEYRPRPKVGGKPLAWFSRERDGSTEYACSRSCIPEREEVLPW